MLNFLGPGALVLVALDLDILEPTLWLLQSSLSLPLLVSGFLLSYYHFLLSYLLFPGWDPLPHFLGPSSFSSLARKEVLSSI